MYLILHINSTYLSYTINYKVQPNSFRTIPTIRRNVHNGLTFKTKRVNKSLYFTIKYVSTYSINSTYK
jgi:hypothetical protein